MDRSALYEYWKAKDAGEDLFSSDCEAIEYILEHCEITFCEDRRFFVKVINDNSEDAINVGLMWDRAFARVPEVWEAHRAALDAMAYSGGFDFNHVSPDWDAIFAIGLPGLLARARKMEAENTDPEHATFYRGVVRVYSAALRFVLRVAREARACGRDEMADGLEVLAVRQPETLFEAMQLTFVMYALFLSVEGTYVRTLGRLDRLYQPFLHTVDSAEAERLFDDLMWEINALKYYANVPFAICGTDAEGNDATNETSGMLLDAYLRCDVTCVKMHFLCSEKTPDAIVKSALDAVRDGKNSIVFLSDEAVIRSLIKQGADARDAQNYHVVGCYECGADNELTCSCNGFLSIPKALEYALNGGVDAFAGVRIGFSEDVAFETFDALFEAFSRQLKHLIDRQIALIDRIEREYPRLHAAPFLSGTLSSTMEHGKDAYMQNGARYCNSSINAMGIATVTDSLYAIKRLVYDEKRLTLSRLREILANNWEGEEALRRTVKKRFPKFGMAEKETDGLANRVMEVLTSAICRRPNVKGGTYRLGTFSIDYRWYYGEKLGASADGRLNGEPMSQNASASFGGDRGGVTAQLLSVTNAIDATDTPNGTVVDIDLHETAIKGANGLDALHALLCAYFQNDGFAVHFNVLHTDVLEAARLHPEDYPNLQVRLCGWNAKFVALSEREQVDFIERSKK